LRIKEQGTHLTLNEHDDDDDDDDDDFNLKCADPGSRRTGIQENAESPAVTRNHVRGFPL